MMAATTASWTRLLLLGALVALGTADADELSADSAHGLTCRQCVIGLLERCLFPTDVVCDNSTLNCFSGNAQFNATGILRLHTRGCLDSDLCGRTLNGVILGAGFTSSFTCCQTDLCNGATSATRPSSVAVAAACCAAVLASPLWAR